MRIQEGHFLKIALNLDLTLSDDGECPALLIFLPELLIQVHSASSYGHFSSAKEFRSQCHIFRFESRLVGNMFRLAIIIYNPIYNYKL